MSFTFRQRRYVFVNVHHKRAFRVLVITVILDVFLGALVAVADHVPVWHGVYCAVGTATTVGCDLSPKSGWSYALFTVMMLTIVPLFTAIFSFFTTGLTSDHVENVTQRQTAELKEHLSDGTR